MSYIPPANVSISDDYDAHVARDSKEPGTDFETAYGTPLVAIGTGTVVYIDNSNQGAEGRRLTVDLDDGRRFSFIHLSKIYSNIKLGKKVQQGHFICDSGASGYGDDWYYGPHVHVSLWERSGLAYSDTIDLEKYLTTNSGGNVTPSTNTEAEDDMDFINVQGKAGSHRAGVFGIFRRNKDNVLVAKRVTTDNLWPGYPTADAEALKNLQTIMPFINLT